MPRRRRTATKSGSGKDNLDRFDHERRISKEIERGDGRLAGAPNRALADAGESGAIPNRHRHGVEPTEYGRALLDCGAAVFDDLRQGVKNMEFLANPTAGEVRIGSIPPLAASFVSAVADRLSRRYPRIVFHVVATQTDALRRALNERDVDLLIAQRFGVFADEQLKFETLYSDSYVVMAGAQNPLVRRRRVVLAELMEEPWTLPPPESACRATIRAPIGKAFPRDRR